MNILVLEETDWIIRGPHAQHHIFERLSKNKCLKITVIDYDIENIQKSNSIIVKKKIFKNISKAVKNSKIIIIRTKHLKIPYLRRISSLITNFIEIIKIIKKNRPDIIFAFSITNGLIGLFLAKIFRIPYIFYCIDLLHTLVPLKQFQTLARITLRFILKKSDQIIVITKLLRNFIINEKIKPEKIKLFLIGIAIENTKIDVVKFNNLKSIFSISDNDFIILFMGYLYEFAGLKKIIDFYNTDVNAGRINLKFIIVGDGGIYNDLKNHIKNIGTNWVILTGRIPFFNLPEYINLADLCLLSFELNEITATITPGKVAEYLALKKPVLSNKLPGVILEFGKNNGVIIANNQDELIKKIVEFIPLKDELKKIGEQGYEYVIKNYLWSNIIRNLKKNIIEVIKKKHK